MTFGSGDYTYRAVEGWGLGPDGWSFGIISSMATDSQSRPSSSSTETAN